jgi:hypothetical protein
MYLYRRKEERFVSPKVVAYGFSSPMLSVLKVFKENTINTNKLIINNLNTIS